MTDMSSSLQAAIQNMDKVTRGNAPPALKNFIHEHAQPFPMVSHPFIHEPFPCFPELMARQYREKHKRFATSVRQREWGDALMWIEKPWKLDMLYRWFKAGVPGLDLPTVLLNTWMYVENCYQFVNEALEMFHAAGYCGDVPKPPDDFLFTIWRGQSSNQHVGMSWTRDPAQAEWFARRLDRPSPIVLETQVKGRDILGMYDGRGESEVIVDPFSLPPSSIKVNKLSAAHGCVQATGLALGK